MNHYTEKNVFTGNESIAIVFSDSPNGGFHTHDFVEMVYIAKGKGYQYIDGKQYSVSHGDMIFINYNHTHAFRSGRVMEYYNIYLKPSFISSKLINADNAMQMLTLTAFEDFRETIGRENPVIRFSGGETREIETCLSAMMREHQHKGSGSDTVLKSYLTILMTYVFRKMAVYENLVPSTKEQGIRDLIRYIEENSAQRLSLTDLAEKCFYNPSYFCRIFKEYSGKTVTEFIHESRIRKACIQLLQTHDSVEKISADVGYTNRTLFYKKFREYTGMSPAAYQKSKNQVQQRSKSV